MDRLPRYTLAAATAACVALGVLGALRVVGWTNLAPAQPGVEIAPLAFDDYALQFYYARLGSRFLTETGATYGYDPNFMAGYVKMPLYYPSSKPFELSLWLFSAFDPVRVFNATAFALMAALPLLVYGAARNFALSPGARLAAVAMSAVPHLMVPLAGFYGIMEASGMLSFVFASSLSVFVVSSFYRFVGRGGAGAGLALPVAAALVCFTHLTAPLLMGVPLLAIYFTRLRHIPPARHAWLWLVLVAVVVANWPWLEGYLLFADYADLTEFYTERNRWMLAPPGGLLAPLHVAVPSPWALALVPPAFAVVGLAAWWRARRRQLLLVFAPQIAALFTVTYYGAYLGLSGLAPARFALPLGLYLFFPAAHGLAVACGALWRRSATLGSRARVAAARAALFAALAAAGLAADLPSRVWRPYSLPELERTHGYDVHGRGLLEWLAEQTDAEGRILHEEILHSRSDPFAHRYYGSHMAALIPLYTGRELANGPAPHVLLKHDYLRFVAGTFRGEPLRRVDPAVLERHLATYNVRWILVWSPSARKYFERHPSTVRVGSYDRFTLYRFEVAPSYFLRGQGRIEVEGDRIRLRELVPEDGVIALKYHWLESMRTDPPRPVEPLFVLDDPVPFISVVDPPRELVIYNDYDGVWDARGD
ncbi:MAG: hypothetical protein V3U03_02955 [Myxococcota bacterium]